jgi:hypothetical protein
MYFKSLASVPAIEKTEIFPEIKRENGNISRQLKRKRKSFQRIKEKTEIFPDNKRENGNISSE